jgi:hypothetical protein
MEGGIRTRLWASQWEQVTWSQYCLPYLTYRFSLSANFYYEDGNKMFLCNVGTYLSDYTASHPGRMQSKCSQQQEHFYITPQSTTSCNKDKARQLAKTRPRLLCKLKTSTGFSRDSCRRWCTESQCFLNWTIGWSWSSYLPPLASPSLFLGGK